MIPDRGRRLPSSCGSGVGPFPRARCNWLLMVVLLKGATSGLVMATAASGARRIALFDRPPCRMADEFHADN